MFAVFLINECSKLIMYRNVVTEMYPDRNDQTEKSCSIANNRSRPD